MEITELEKIAKEKQSLGKVLDDKRLAFSDNEKEEANDTEEFENEVDEIDDGVIDDDDEPVVAGLSGFSESDGEMDIDETESDDDDEDTEEESALFSMDEIESELTFGLLDEDLRELAPDLTDEEFTQKLAIYRKQTAVYRKSLIINEGLDKEEADEAASNHLRKLISGENTKKLEENPKVGVIEINKKDVNELGLTEDEHAKLNRVKSINLVMVEDEELKNIKIKKVDKKHKAKYLKVLDGNLSRYSVPLPATGDYVTFKGTQIMQILSTVKYEDDSLDEALTKKASLLYDRICDGNIIEKFDNRGKVKLTFNQFISDYKYHDLDMGLYAIMIATSKEEIETSLTCPDCHGTFEYTYNIKSLLNMDNISDKYKDITEQILANKSNKEKLIEINSENSLSQRFRSTITNNIYDVGLPSIGRAINLFRTIDQDDEVMIYLSAPALFLDKVLVYDQEEDDYYPIEENEYQDLMEFIQTIPDEELQLINKVASDKIYSPDFILKSKCPLCGRDLENHFSIDQLVFLKARGMQREIR